MSGHGMTAMEDVAEGVEEARSGAQTLLRGLDLIEQAVREPMRMTELVERSGLSRSTGSRLVTALIRQGFLAHGPGGRVRGGPALIRLGVRAQDRFDLVTIARPLMVDLAERTGLSSFLGQREGDQSVHLHRAQGRERVIVATPVGARRNLAETSMGKALLFDDGPGVWRRLLADADPAYRSDDWEDRMRADIARGVVIHHGPPPDMIRAVAAPVRDASGRIVGAVTLATAAQYLETDQLEPVAQEVRAVARTIGEALGWQP